VTKGAMNGKAEGVRGGTVEYMSTGSNEKQTQKRMKNTSSHQWAHRTGIPPSFWAPVRVSWSVEVKKNRKSRRTLQNKKLIWKKGSFDAPQAGGDGKGGFDWKGSTRSTVEWMSRCWNEKETQKHTQTTYIRRKSGFILRVIRTRFGPLYESVDL
jgi:hypothetical protein